MNLPSCWIKWTIKIKNYVFYIVPVVGVFGDVETWRAETICIVSVITVVIILTIKPVINFSEGESLLVHATAYTFVSKVNMI